MSIIKREPKTYQVVFLEEDENVSKLFCYSDEVIPGTFFTDFWELGFLRKNKKVLR